jgi:putative aldouronate transport system permease protein
MPDNALVMPEKKKSWDRIKSFIPLYLMMLPGAVYLIINNYIPMGGIITSLSRNTT